MEIVREKRVTRHIALMSIRYNREFRSARWERPRVVSAILRDVELPPTVTNPTAWTTFIAVSNLSQQRKRTYLCQILQQFMPEKF